MSSESRGQPAREQPFVRWRLLFGFAFAVSLCVTMGTLGILALQPAGVDFLPVWTAARLAAERAADVYDFTRVTDLQRWLIGEGGTPRPFIYPPSALVLMAPFGVFDFRVSFALWLVCTGGLYLWSVSRNLTSLQVLSLAFIVTGRPVLLAGFAGQASLLVAALILMGLSMLERRPLAAGILIGLAASVKPALLALAPLCLVAGRHYRALAGAFFAGAATGLASLLAFGPEPWLRWFAALGAFETLVIRDHGFLPNMITPTAAALQLNLQGVALLLVRVGFAAAGAAIGWIVFRTPRPLEQRVTALVASGLFLSPYALHYEAIMLAPAAVIVLARTAAQPRWWLGPQGLLLLTIATMPYLGPYGTLGLIALVLFSDPLHGQARRRGGRKGSENAQVAGCRAGIPPP